MRHRILKIVVLSILLFGILGADVVNGNTDETCNSVTNVFLNKTFCDRKTIVIEGEVKDLIFTISDAEHKFTTFNISEDNNNIIVFSYGYLRIGEGDTVKVTGTYYIEYIYKNYTFYDEIVTDYKRVIPIKQNTSWVIHGIILMAFLALIIGVLYYKRSIDPKIKGTKFEKYVISLFDEDDWSVMDYASDLSQKLGRRIMRDSNPDIVVKHKKSKVVLAVECKYFSRFSHIKEDRTLRFKNYQLINYKTFQTETEYKTFIAVGVGASPKSPSNMYLIPLDVIHAYLQHDTSYITEKKFNQYQFTPRKFQIDDFIIISN